ncbi:MAG: Modification methylase StsI [Candidatus Daviesbacteria bacterium GW2011_GWB1_41_5]|uniref:LexA repressor n=1 Tax=Candidatus Daviesbacteria bacterium GW2011_GWB1_41_5 TaxID=1618429 RepID=A0A0G0WLG0_9BACT|nr:MAG: Modification methylase StsI [Candidatus Daviesbacteria bacterium GW2011_GWB1_41_5]
MPYPITKRQKQVYDFVKVFIDDKGYSPTLEEIKKRLRLSAVSTVHQHINALIDKGYIKRFDNLARAIEINGVTEEDQNFIEIPLLGMIAAGEPIEAIEIPETISVPKELTLGQGRHYGLKVRGDSMQDAGIFDSDTVIVREQPVVDNGEIGVAIVNGNEATLKRIYKEKNGIRLQPANKNYKPILTKNVLIQGRVTGVLRSRFDPLPKPAQLPLFMYPQKNEQLLQIHNRRFLGNKTKLLGFIGDIVADKCRGYYTFCDIFAGTGVVGQYFNRPDTKIISNDILDSSFTSLQCWLGTKNYNKDKISNTTEYLNSIESNKENYVSENFGNSYFTKENAQKIGAIRDEIERLNNKGEISKEEKSVLLTSLVYAIDKVANTVGHYEAYRKKLDTIQGLRLLVPDIDVKNNANNEIYQKDANQLVREIKCDVLYIDPPYNSRQYGDSYHLLENIITWKKPRVEGVAKKMVNRAHLKSRYCIKGADNAFEDLIQNVKAKHILVSYNNTGEKKNVRSNAKISDERIIAILKNKGDVEVFERDYKGFTAGKSDTAGHTERVFYCKVTK